MRGKWFFSAAAFALVVLSVATGPVFAASAPANSPFLLLKHPNVSLIAISPDGRLLASGSSDEYIGPGEVKVWDVATGRLRKFLYHEYEVDDLAFSPDNKTLAIASGGDIRLWDVRTWKLKHRLRNDGGWQFTCSVAFSPDGKTIAGGSGMAENGEADDAYLWDARTGRLKCVLPHSNGKTSIVFSLNGQTLAGVTSDEANGIVNLWNMRTGLLKSVHQHPWVQCLAISPDGKTLATGSSHEIKEDNSIGEIRLWDMSTGRLLRTLQHESGIISLAYSPDGSLRASTDMAGTVRFSESATGQVKRELTGIGAGEIAFSHDGRFLACACDNGTVQLWAMR